MAVKVVRPPQEEPVFKTKCKCCKAELEYSPSDERTTSWWEPHAIKMFEDYIYCPVCSSKIIIREYYKDYL